MRSRWLILWALAGAAAFTGAAILAEEVLGITVSEDLLAALMYLPIVAWVWFMVVRRAHVDLRVLFRWPRLGAYWWVVAGMLVAQFLFSAGAIILTDLLVPTLDDSLAGVGQGNLLIALVAIAILPPLVEETVFRGVLLERWSSRWRVGVAVVVSAVCFGILHADPVGAGVFGVVTGLLYLRTGSLWPGILIHGANNLVALTLTRGAESTAAAPEVPIVDSLITAGVLLAVSLPFVVWFIWVTWPRRGTATPYQLHESRVGLPDRNLEPVLWSAVPYPVRLDVTSTHLVVSPAGPGATPVAFLPLGRLRSVYPSPIPGGTQVVVLLTDGTWTTLHVPSWSERASRSLALAITERAQRSSPSYV